MVGTDFLYQGTQVGKTTNLAIGLGGFGKIDIGKGMCLDTVLGYTKMLQQLVAHQVRWLTIGITHSQIDIGFAEIDRVQLGMTVGHVHQTDITELRNIVHLLRAIG